MRGTPNSGVHVRVREVARTRKDLLAVGLVWQVAGGALEDDEVEREALTQRPHQCKLVQQSVLVYER